MKRIYLKPEADLTVFRPVEALAGQIQWEDLLSGSYSENTDRTAAQTLSGDIAIKI